MLEYRIFYCLFLFYREHKLPESDSVFICLCDILLKAQSEIHIIGVTAASSLGIDLKGQASFKTAFVQPACYPLPVGIAVKRKQVVVIEEVRMFRIAHSVVVVKMS